MNKIPLWYTVCFLIIFLSCTSNNHEETAYKIAYKNDENGNVLQGSKTELIHYIRSGAPIRIGWGAKGKTRSIEHVSEPIWIAVLNETEVIAQLQPHYSASTDWDALTSSFSDSTLINQEWRVVLTTKGTFDAVWYDKHEGKQIRRVPQDHPMTWFVQGAKGENKPLYLNE